MQQQCAIIDPAVISTLQSSKGIRSWSLTTYESPTPDHFNALASVEIPDLSALVWHVIEW